MFKLRFDSIKTRVRLFFFANIALVIFNYFYTVYVNYISERDRQYLEISKESEKYIERISFRMASIIENPEQEKGLKVLLKKDISNYRDNLEALDRGGTALISGGRETIELSTPPFRGRTELRELKVSWNELSDLLKVILEERIQKDTTLTSPTELAPAETPPADTLFEELAPADTPQDSLEVAADSLAAPTPPSPAPVENIPYYVTVINPEVDRAYFLAQTTVEEVSSKNRELSEIYEEGLNNSQAFLRTILLGTFIANLIALIVGTFVIGSYLINPLKDIAATAKDVASGDTRTQVVYHRKDEIGEVADSLNLIVASFRQYTDFADNVGKENFESSFEVKSEKDTLGFTLLKMRDSLKAAAEEDQKRNWANEGFAQFSAILRSNEQDLEEFSYGIISNLVKYLDANQGGLFIMTESEPPVLEMKAAFAYNKRKYDEKQIQIGQGLLGQVVLEKDLIYLDNAPDEYVQITSGLGRANPRHVLICPLMVNDEVLGALEIASFKPFPPHELDFVRRLSENIASTLSALRISKNTQKLLEETRQYAEQMQAQEEEMRQNMEVLASTQDEMTRNQRKLEEYKINLEREVERRTAELQEKEATLANTLFQLQAIINSAKSGIVAIDTQYRVVAANERSKEMIRLILGHEFNEGDYWLSLFKTEDERLRSKKLWDRALGGKYYNTEEGYLIEGGIRKWFDLAYNPIQNESNQVIGASLFIRDITQRKQNQRNTELTAHILDNSSNEVYVFDTKTLRFTYINERGRRNLGYTLDELRQMTPIEIQANFDQKAFRQFIAPLEAGQVENLLLETQTIRKDGSSYDVELNLQLFEDEERPQFAAIAQDISQRKRNEQSLKDALTRFDLATSATNEGFWEMEVKQSDPVNPDNPAWWSKRFARLLGYEDQSLEPKLHAWSARLHPDDHGPTLRMLYDHLTDATGQTPYEIEYRLLHKNGDYIWFSASAATLRDEAGTPLKVAGSIRDIHRRKKAEQELLERNAVVTGIFNAAVNCIIALDPAQHILSVNAATEKIFGYPAQALLGKPFAQLLAQSEALDLENALDQVRELEARHLNGHTFTVEMSVSQTIQEQQKNFVVILRDVTARKIREKTLAESEARLRTLAQASREGVFIQENGHIVEANPAFFDILGLQREEVIDQPPPPALARLLPSLRSESNEGQTYEGELERQNGEIAFVQIQAHALPHQPGSQWQAFSLRDISHLRRKEQNTALLIHTLDLVPELICHTNAKGQLLYLNQAARKWLGQNPETDLSLLLAEQLFTPETWAKIQSYTQAQPSPVVFHGHLRLDKAPPIAAMLTLLVSENESNAHSQTLIIQPEAQLN